MSLNILLPIGKYYKLKNVIYSHTANINNINNMPGVDGDPNQTKIIENLKNLFTNVVDPIIDAFPNLQLTSGYRSLILNSKVGGSKRSQHIKGQAADIRVPSQTSAEIYNFIFYNINSWDQLIWEFPEKEDKAWIHVSYGGRGQRETMLASCVDGYHDIYGGTRLNPTKDCPKGIYQKNIGPAKYTDLVQSIRNN
tara:strand:+ start:1883 stop:2467 length:585 start_codon:yes stop_codon:yes gene_type:complete